MAGPGLVPWMSDAAFLAGMTDYLGSNSGVGNLTIRNWAEVNLANFPVSSTPRLYVCQRLPGRLMHAMQAAPLADDSAYGIGSNG